MKNSKAKEIKTSYKEERRREKAAYKSEKKYVKKTYKQKAESLKEQYVLDIAAVAKERGKRVPVNPPKRPVLEEIGNSVTHGIGSLFALFALLLMLLHADTPTLKVGAWVYFAGLFIMFTMSCLYHAFPYGSRVKRIFRRFDYTGIYLLIGATFAPLLLSYVGGIFGFVFFCIQWCIIITGITFIGVFGPTRLKFIHFPLYVVLGWCAVMFLPQMFVNDLWLAVCILGGGIVYSVGIIPFAMKGRVAHFIWHFFVLAGAIVQWIGIYLYIYC